MFKKPDSGPAKIISKRQTISQFQCQCETWREQGLKRRVFFFSAASKWRKQRDFFCWKKCQQFNSSNARHFLLLPTTRETSTFQKANVSKLQLKEEKNSIHFVKQLIRHRILEPYKGCKSCMHACMHAMEVRHRRQDIDHQESLDGKEGRIQQCVFSLPAASSILR